MSTAETLITDHLDTWSSAIKAKSSAGRGGGKKQEFYGIKKLRELILELAVRGLLVAQDATEKSALKCLKESNAGILEFEKMPAQAAPSGWLSLQLGCIIASNLGGGTPSKSNPNYWGGEIPWASVKDIQDEKFIDSTIDSITADGLKNSSSNLIPPNRLLIVTRMGLGKLAINKCAIAINQDLRAIEPISALDLNYGYLLFKALNLVGTGMTVKGVKVKELHAIQVLLPPLAEQHRIVVKVDELMALCDQLEQQQSDSARAHGTLVQILLGALTAPSEHGQFEQAWKRIEANFDTLFTTEGSIDQLKQAILQLAVMGKLILQDPNDEPATKLFSRITAEKVSLIESGEIRNSEALSAVSNEEMFYGLPPTWNWHRLSNITSVLGDGIHGTPEYDPNGGYYFINGNNLNDGTIEIKPETKRVSQKEYEEHKKPLGKNTVLVSINGTIGRVAFYNNEKVVLGKSACYFNLLGSINLDYIKTLIQTDYFVIYALREATGSTIKNVSLRAMREFPVPLPPLAEQHRIVAKVNELMILCDRLKASLQTAQATQLNLADSLVDAAIH